MRVGDLDDIQEQGLRLLVLLKVRGCRHERVVAGGSSAAGGGFDATVVRLGCVMSYALHLLTTLCT